MEGDAGPNTKKGMSRQDGEREKPYRERKNLSKGSFGVGGSILGNPYARGGAVEGDAGPIYTNGVSGQGEERKTPV